MEPVQFKKLHPDAIIPMKAKKLAAGYDLYAREDTLIKNEDGVVKVDTGIAVKLPYGFYGRIAMRSGHAYKQHFACTAGVIDADYRGDVGVLLFVAKKDHQYMISKGERIAQLIIEAIHTGPAVEVTEFDDVDLESHTGYGSTGI